MLLTKAGPKVSYNSMNGLVRSVVCIRRDRAIVRLEILQGFSGLLYGDHWNAGVAEGAIRIPRTHMPHLDGQIAFSRSFSSSSDKTVAFISFSSAQ